MARIEAEAWEREPRESPRVVQEQLVSIGPRVGQAQAAKGGRFWDEPVAMCDRLEADSGERCVLRSCPRPRDPQWEVA